MIDAVTGYFWTVCETKIELGEVLNFLSAVYKIDCANLKILWQTIVYLYN